MVQAFDTLTGKYLAQKSVVNEIKQVIQQVSNNETEEEIEKLQNQVDQCIDTQTQLRGQITQLEEQKAKHVAAKQYRDAKRIKEEI